MADLLPPPLQLASNNLNSQVGKGWINQGQADAELNRLKGLGNVQSPQTEPALQAARANLQDQVSKGWISQAQADAEANRLSQQSFTGFAKPDLKLESPFDVLNTTFDAGKAGQMQGNLYTNPNQQGPFGSQNVTIDPITGQPTVSQGLSQGNQNVVGGIQGSSMGASSALNSLLGGGIFGSLNNAPGEGGAAPQSNLESAVFQRLTHGLDDQKERDRAQLEQTLSQRGIPMGGKLYDDQFKQLNDRYDQLQADAKARSVEQGTNASLQALPALSGVGQAGFFNPNFQGFNAVGYQQPDIGQLFSQLSGNKQFQDQLALQKQQFEFQKQQAAKMGGGGGGGEDGNFVVL